MVVAEALVVAVGVAEALVAQTLVAALGLAQLVVAQALVAAVGVAQLVVAQALVAALGVALPVRALGVGEDDGGDAVGGLPQSWRPGAAWRRERGRRRSHRRRHSWADERLVLALGRAFLLRHWGGRRRAPGGSREAESRPDVLRGHVR